MLERYRELPQHPDIRLYDEHILDSLKTVELMLALSQQLGVELAPAEMEREEWATPQRIVAYIEQRLAQ